MALMYVCDLNYMDAHMAICNKGFGIESGLSLPSGFVLTASSFVSGNEAIKGRLSGALSWCANTNNANEYIQIDFGKTITMTGIAVQGNPTASSWVKDFYVEYGITETSLAAYTEKGVNKLFVGNANQSTIVVNWFQVRLKARYVRVKPNTFNGNKCMRFEIIGCDTVDLGRTMLVNGIATQGDPTYASNYFSDYKLQFSQSNANFVSVKREGSSSIKIFAGNTNNMGVKFNLLKVSPISTRYVQFLKNTETLNDDALRVEIYALPQVCSSSFGMEAGEPSTYEPTITVSTGIVPSSKAKINSNAAWCAGNATSSHNITFDFGKVKQISGVAIQGHPLEDKWVKKFKIQYGSSLSSLTTYSEGNSEKEFIGCNSRNLIVYNWFSAEITARYLRILPTDSNNEVCLRLNVYGCPSTECFKRIGIGSSATIAITASTYSTGNEAFKSRFNSLTTWAACQVGSCTPKEATGSKPWIQLCLGSAHTFSAVVIQGHGDHDNIADVKTFSVQYKYTQGGTIYDYKLDGTNKIFSASPGRYGSKQADFPIAIAAKCLRIKVESQTDTLKNVGLRWELLGCNSVTKTSVTLTTSSLSIARGSKSTVTCSVTGQEGGVMSYKISGTTITNSDIYSLGTQTRTNANINGVIQRNIEITANGPSVGRSFTSCSITDSAQSVVQCQKSIDCSVGYADIPSLGNSKSFTVTITGLLAKPQAPTGFGANSITNTSAKVTWTAAVARDVPVESYKVSIKKKSDGTSAGTDQTVTVTEVMFTNLTPFTEYTVEVTAKSRNVNVFSPIGTHSFKTDEGVATAPTNITLTPLSATEITVTWEMPASMNGILHNYQIRFKKSSEKAFITFVASANELSRIMDNLDAFTDYVIQVAATTKQGIIFGDWSNSIRERTHESVPLEPKALHVVSTQSRSTVLRWDKPSKENGIIRNYTIRLRGTKGYNSTFHHEKSIVLSVNSSTRLSLDVSDLVPGSVYSVQIAAATIKGYGPYSSSITLTTLYAEPLAPEIVREVQVNGGTNVILKRASNINGPITHYAFGVTIGIKGCRLESHREIIKPSRIPLTLQFVPGSETVPGISFKFNKIGSFTLCFRAVTANMSELLFGKPSSTVIEQTTLLGTPKPNTDETDAQSNQTQTPFSTASVSIIAVLVLIIIVLVVVVVILKRRKPSSSPQKEIEPIPMAQYASLGANRAYEYDGYESLTMETNISNKETRDVTISGSSAASVRHKQPPSHVEIYRHHQPIAVHDFAEFSRNLQTDCHRALSLEYNQLKKGQLYSWETAMTAANQSKNRYPNIAAYDHSRVHLQPLAGQTNIDYFNANLISSYNRPSVYIAAQDPHHGNEAAFWRMNWDNNVPAIIMLSSINEGAETQCANYWPHQGKVQFGDISVTLDSVDSDPDFVIRRFTVSRKGQSESRIVYQFQFLSWPRSGVPKFPTDILRFRQTVRKSFRFETKPSIVVHCTDGIGRTGTFIVIDAMLDLAAKEQKIDVFNYVNFIRTQRIELVSAEEQYSFIYDALLEATMRVSTEFEADDIKTTAAQLQVLNNGKTGYQMQFELLNSVTHCFSTIETLNLLKPENERRNRNKNILPRDSYRVVLQESIYENASSDYVNATFVDGYKREYGFIATEHPFPKTMAAFWSMVLENNVTMIVMLNELKEGSLKYPTFWPSVGSETKYGHILVKNQSSSDKEEKDLTHITIHIRHGSMAKNSREVDMYQFHYWPNHATPKNTSQLLSLLNKLNVSESNKQQGNNKHSTLVMCSDGAGRTGTFIAIANILERLKSEQLIDVFHTVKKIRLFRPQFVENSAQYQFCFKMAQAYMESFGTYSTI
eukprot:gene8093-8960_t